MTQPTNAGRRVVTVPTPPVTHLRARLHASVFCEPPALISFIGILAFRYKAADLAFVSTTLAAIDKAEAIRKASAPVSKHASIDEDMRLIFQMFEGPRLLQITPVGYMGTNDLRFPKLSTGEGDGDRDVIEAAISLRDKYIVTSRIPTLSPARDWLFTHNIRLLSIRELAFDLRDLSGDVYRAVLNEHRRGMDATPGEHTEWLNSNRLPNT